MNDIKLEIEGTEENFRAVWVHLQRIKDQNSSEFRILVPISYATQVFDPFKTKGENTSWTNYIETMITQFGTFIVEAFFQTSAAIVGDRERAYKWVIASVDTVSETEEEIELIGRVVPFMNRGGTS